MSSLKFSGARVIVTGGTGFIGYSLLKQLRNLHPDVVPIALARPTSDVVRLQRLLDYQQSSPTVFTASLQDIPALQQCIRDADVLIHLACDMDFHTKNTTALFRTNVEGTRNLLEACSKETKRRGKQMRFVYVSSTEAVGCTEELGEADEDAQRRPDSDYANSKALAEDIVKEYANRLNIVIARPTGVFGPGERFFYFEFMNMVASGIAIVTPSPMSGKIMFTHVDDVVQGLMVCATHPKAVGGVFHICPDESISYWHLVEVIADILEVPRPKFALSQRFGEIIIRIIAPLMNRGKKRVFVYHPRTVQRTMVNREYSNQRLRALGYKPKYSILSGTEQTLRHEMSTGSIKREFFPTALKACVNFAGVVTFTVHRFLRRYQE